MSTEIYKMYENVYVRDVIHIGVISEQPKISDYVRRMIHEKGLSYRKVADKSGGLITHSTVSDVVNERIENLSTQVIAGLAKGLGVTEHEIYLIVRGKSPEGGAIIHEKLRSMDFAYDGMPKTKQEKADYIIDLLEREFERIKNEPD